jgi:hypothetical protein
MVLLVVKRCVGWHNPMWNAPSLDAGLSKMALLAATLVDCWPRFDSSVDYSYVVALWWAKGSTMVLAVVEA